ncbi:MAG TPA: phospholipase D-like domain-containing protein [Thermoanaerobaculia bacterium]|nr:phospholipase D-like domain-containing protein [Thermoanaerobaculia bacterium]
MPPFSTEPQDWFLSPDEIGSRGLPAFTSNNVVIPYVDAKEYMKDVHDLIRATRVGDYIYLAGLELSLDLRLLGGSEFTEQQKKDSQIGKLLEAAHSRGVYVRILLSGDLATDNEEVCEYLDTLGITCIIDRRQPLAGTPHQKILLILINHDGGSKTLHGFCGGIDLALNRYDESGHPAAEEDRQPTKDAYKGGWHDVHCRLLGPVCCDLEATFLERWNDPHDPSSLDNPPEKIERQCDALAVGGGALHVQVLRTYACRSNPQNRYPFAPFGEFTARNAVLKAINLAREYIYIEDQYFVSNEVADALLLSLALHPELRIIVVVPPEPDNAIAAIYMKPHQGLLIEQILRAAEGRFAIFQLRNPALQDASIYVHSKTVIVDDVWVEIGSMNMNRRSMTHDQEISLSMIDAILTPDGNHCRFARELRLRLWAEHLGLDPSEIAVDPVAGFEQWKERSQLAGVRAKRHFVELDDPFELSTLTTMLSNLPIPFYNKIIDPQGLCRDKKSIPPPPYRPRSF